MLRLWRNKVTVVLSGSGIEVSKSGRRSEKDVLFRKPIVFAEGSPKWKAALEVLEDVISEPEIGQEVAIIVGDSFAKYALVPWPNDDAVLTRMEQYASVYFEDLFAADVSAWSLQLDWSCYGQPGFVVALEKEFLRALQELLKQRGKVVGSIRTQFVNNFNCWHGRSRTDNVLLASIDGAQCVMALIQRRRWISVRSTRWSDSGADPMSVALQRELVIHGLPSDYQTQILVGHGSNFEALESRAEGGDATP